MRLGDDLLAPVAGLAGGWGVAKAARIAAVPVARSRSCGLVAGCCGQRQHTGVGGGGKNRPQSYGQTGASLAASIMCLPTPRPGDAFGGNLDRGQPPRCDVRSCCPWWMRRRRCGDGRGVGRARFTGLGLMLPGGIGKPCGGEGALRRPWPVARGGSPPQCAWGCTGGWWSGRWGGWLHLFRRLRVRYERRADIHEAFLALGCSLIYFSSLPSCAGASPVPFSSTP